MQDPLSKVIKELEKSESELSYQLERVRAALKAIRNEINPEDIDTRKQETLNFETIKSHKFIVNEHGVEDDAGDDSMSNKFIRLLEREKRFLHFREAAILIGRDEELPNSEIKELAESISSRCTHIKKRGRIKKVQIGNYVNNTFWGFPDWFTDDNKIKKQYRPNGRFVSGGYSISPYMEK